MLLKIRMTPVAQLVPYAGNARTHSEQQITQIAASITEFGFTKGIPMLRLLEVYLLP